MKRRMFKLAVFLILGAITSIGIAVGCALFVPYDRPSNAQYRYIDGRMDVYRERRGFGSNVIIQSPDMRRFGKLFSDKGKLGGDWTRVAEADPGILYELVYNDDEVWAADGRGWPVLCLYWTLVGEQNESGARRTEVNHGWDLGGNPSKVVKRATQSVSVGSLGDVVIPLKPIWPGFAINTVFYAAMMGILTLGPFTARRVVRRRRGHCIECGYDLSHAEHEVCPECGAVGELYVRGTVRGHEGGGRKT